MEFGSINVVPERSCFSKSDYKIVNARSFDIVKQSKFTMSFISYVLNCYEIIDTQLLVKIVPEQFSELYQQDNVINEIVSFFKVYGIQIDTSPNPTDHFSAVQNAIYNNNDSNIVYSKENFLKDCQSEEDIDFNFTSKNIIQYMNIISVQLQKPVIALYYTQLGFLRLSSQPLDSETIADSQFFIILGQDSCIVPEFTQFSVIHPQENFGMRKAGLSFFPLIKFELINGYFHPNFNDQSFAHFTANCTSHGTRTDSYSFPYDFLIGKSTILVGLIGVYSKIVKFLSHPAVKVNLVESFDETAPFIGIYISKTAYLFMFLFIPNDLPPSHPLYRDVTIYSTSLMQRICTRTFFLSEDDNEESNFSVKSDFHIGGLSHLYNNRIIGGFDTSLILHCEPSSCVGSSGKKFIQFNSCDELILWKQYISRRFQVVTIASEKTQNDSLPLNQVIQLITDHDYSSNKSRIQKIINGNKNSQQSETDESIRKWYNEYSKSDDDESKSFLLSACNQKMDEFTLLFNQASHWMKVSSFVLSNHCEFCDLPCDEKPDQDSPLWSNACFRCKLIKTKKFNEKSRSSKRPTQFLEEKVDELKQNEADCEMLQSTFRSYLLNSEPSEINSQIFTKWLFEYWTVQSFDSGIDQIKTTENVEINENIKKEYKKDDINFSLFDFINKLTGSQLEGIEYYSILPFIFLQVPIEKDSDTIRECYLNYFIENVVPILSKPPELSPYMFFERCKEEVAIMSQSGFADDSIVEFSNIRSTTEGGNTIEVEINWKEKNLPKSGESSNYTFYSISDISLVNSSFTSKPMNCTTVVSLNSQPLSLFIVNSFYLSKFSRTVIVSVLGESLWINVIKDGFKSAFLPNPIFTLEVEKDSGKSTFCSFASLANLVVLFAKSKSGQYECYSVQISRDFSSSNIVAHRSFKQMAPLSSRSLFSSTLYGFTISNDASVGIFCSDYYYTPTKTEANNKNSNNNNFEDDENENDGHDFVLIRFDPWTLIAKQREDSLDSPFNPIFISSSSLSRFPYKLICHCENDSSLVPQNAKLFRIPLDEKRLDEVLGVVLWRGEPRIVKLNEMNEPVFELPESFSIEAPLSFLPKDAVNIVTDSIDKFGLSEADRLSANGHYPVDRVTVDSILDIQSHRSLLDDFFKSGKESATNGIELRLFAHQNPASFTPPEGSNAPSLMDIDVRPKDKNDPKKSFFPLVQRITASPRFLIRSPMQPTVVSSNGCTSTILEESFIHRKSSFPPLPLIRELIQKGEIESRTFSVVNGNSSFSDDRNGFNSIGKDAEIISAYSGLQFVAAPPGSVRLGSTIVPTEFNEKRKFEKFYILNALSFAPVESNSAVHCALTLLHAVSCSGAVAFVTDRDVDFVIEVFKMMCESIPAVESNAQHVRFECANDEGENEKNSVFEPAQAIVVVCNLGRQHEKEAEKLKNGISSLIAGLGPGNICFDILSKDIVAIPVDLQSREIAQVIADSVILPSVDLEISTGRILDFVATYGSFIDNTYLFRFS